jgi:hypothetical protein
MSDRRRTSRLSVDLFVNKYIRGYPYLCRTVDLSPGGLLAETFTEPDTDLESFALEFRIPGMDRSIWAWARSVRRDDARQAIEFLSMDTADSELLAGFVA